MAKDINATIHYMHEAQRAEVERLRAEIVLLKKQNADYLHVIDMSQMAISNASFKINDLANYTGKALIDARLACEAIMSDVFLSKEK